MEFELRKATIAEADHLTLLIKEVWEGMEHKEWFAPEEEEGYIRQLIETDTGVIWTATDTISNETAGLFIVVYPGKENPDNLGYDLNFSSEELCKVAHMDTVAVHPRFRGYGLQRLLVQKAEEELRKSGYRHLLCTVHPDNDFSRSNMEKAGYRIAKQTLKYGGLPRLIMWKENLF